MIHNSAKTILCYGDSNTWGNVPRSDMRYPRDVRWPGKLQIILGDDYEVISEGLCGRTLVAENPKKPHRTGITHLQAIFESADPIDLAIIMLGSNDVKKSYQLTPAQIAEHLSQTIDKIRSLGDLEKAPQILVVCPPPVIVPKTGDLDERMVAGIEAFKTLPALFKGIAEKYKCGFIDAGEHVSSSDIDGYHLDGEAHIKLAEIIGAWIHTHAL
ncbi:MAG: GDSL-type esterase/lipase family protein [Patescibacteria group bacterium]